MDRAKRSRSLLDGLGSDQLVIVRRRAGEPVRGFVAGCGRRWALIRSCEQTSLGALVAVRHRDIRTVRADPYQRTVRTALGLRGSLSAKVPGAWLDDTAGLLRWATNTFAAVTVFSERHWPASRHVGVVTRIDRRSKRFELAEIGPDGVRWPKPFRWKFGDLDRLDLGDRYAADLLAVAALSSPGVEAEVVARLR